jgi:hypothetical protein
MLQLVKVGELSPQSTPPPMLAEFALMVQFAKVGEDQRKHIPPPLSARPF